MNQPAITVLMPVYNGEKFLREAIESILCQTFTDLEFLIIDDGSTDRSAEIIRSYQDPRIRLVCNESNLGLIKTLNKGIDLAKGNLIARMDADDISHTERFHKQYEFLTRHPEIGAAGTWFRMIHSGTIIRHPIKHEDIQIALLQYCPIGHPTVMMRKDVLCKYALLYDEKYLHAEDYELWTRTVNHFQLANIPEVLVNYRDHPEQIGEKFKQAQETMTDDIRLGLIRKLEADASEEELQMHLMLMKGLQKRDWSFILSATQWLEKLQKKNQESKMYPEEKFLEFLASVWAPLILTAPVYNKRLFSLYKNSPLAHFAKIATWDRIKLFVKCIIGG